MSAKSATIRSRIEPELKHEWTKTLDQLGMSESEAINVFVRQVVMHQGIPFDVKIPNAKTQAAMSEDLSGTKRHRNAREMHNSILEEQD